MKPIIGRENTPQSGLQKRLKGKGKATDSKVTTTSSTGISTTDETIMFNKITLVLELTFINVN
jgi:hypothetical protein